MIPVSYTHLDVYKRQGRYYVCLIPYRVSDVVTGVVQVQIGFLAWICIGVGLRTGKVSCEYRIRNLLAMDLHGYT